MNSGPEDSEKEQRDSKRKEDIRKDFQKTLQRWYQEIVGDYYQEGARGPKGTR